MLKTIANLSLRFRTFLFFLMLGLCVLIIIPVTFYVAHDHILTHGDVAASLFLFALVACVGILGCVVLLGFLFDVNIASPIQELIRDVEMVLHGNQNHDLNMISGRYLDHLPETVGTLVQEYRIQKEDIQKQIEQATDEATHQRQTLEAILKDLYQGVIICNLNNQVLLYNQKALTLLHVSGEIGLGRSLFSVIDSPPLMHSLRRLRNRIAENRHLEHPEGVSTSFVCASVDARFTFEASMSLVLNPDGEATSYVLTFDDMTAELTALGKRDHLLRAATDGMRQPIANLRAAAEMLSSQDDLDADLRARFDRVLLDESKILSERLDDLAREYHGLATRSWPMHDVYSANLLSLVVLRLKDEKNIKAVMTGIPVWLHADSHSLFLALVEIVQSIYENKGITEFDLQAAKRGERLHLDIIWTGSPLTSATIDSWMDHCLDETIGNMSLRDILEHHHCEMWSEELDSTRARLRLPMLAPRQRGDLPVLKSLPARPEFYDFNLMKPTTYVPENWADVALSDLPFVVFDTETTGLKPSSGDEILAIAGVRILNGRILTGESFAQLVNPLRSIPKASIKFHGITDEMVKDKPPARIVLPQFHEFAKDTVLVAHNAAFDMKFLELKEAECQVSFDQPVLDTMLLSSYLTDHASSNALDDIAERFGVEIEGRHTAIGDALVTAGIFQRMIPLLKARGILTLADALEACRDAIEKRVQEAEF